MVMKSLTPYFSEQNKIYDSRGLTWHVDDNHFWLELHISKTTSAKFRESNQIKEVESEAEEEEGLTPGAASNRG